MASLLTHTIDDTDLFCSRELTEGDQKELSLELIAQNAIQFFLERNPKHNEMVKLYSQMNNLKRNAILAAHGDDERNTWLYYTGENGGIPVQKWINKMDGKYAVLMLYCCNPGAHTIYSKKSAVLASNSVYSPMKQMSGKLQIELFLPPLGYVDSYTIDYALDNMRKSANKTADKPKPVQ
jgi:hypothetical protein